MVQYFKTKKGEIEMKRINVLQAKEQIKQNFKSESKTEDKDNMSNLSNLIVTAFKRYEAKKIADDKFKEIQKTIIEQMNSLKLSTLSVSGIKCTKSERTNRSCDEQGLLEYCKSLKIPGLVKKVEVIDLDVLGDLTYRKEIDPDEVEKFYTKSVTESLRLSGKLSE